MVPAAAVIPSLTGFSYAVAVETLVANTRDSCHCEESGALTAGSLHRPAQDGKPALSSRVLDATEGAAERAVFAGDG